MSSSKTGTIMQGYIKATQNFFFLAFDPNTVQ